MLEVTLTSWFTSLCFYKALGFVRCQLVSWINDWSAEVRPPRMFLFRMECNLYLNLLRLPFRIVHFQVVMDQFLFRVRLNLYWNLLRGMCLYRIACALFDPGLETTLYLLLLLQSVLLQTVVNRCWSLLQCMGLHRIAAALFDPGQETTL